MVLLVMIAVLAVSNPAMVACQTEESATTEDATTTEGGDHKLGGRYYYHLRFLLRGRARNLHDAYRLG
jgi:hypothetical protein